MAEAPIDLIHMEGEGNSVVLRVTGDQDAEVLNGELLVASTFVRGTLSWPVSPAELRSWQEALDELDAGYDVAWREDADGPAMFIERDPDFDRLNITIKDDVSSLTTVVITVPIADSWFDDAYERLDLTWKTWPNMARDQEPHHL